VEVALAAAVAMELNGRDCSYVPLFSRNKTETSELRNPSLFKLVTTVSMLIRSGNIPKAAGFFTDMTLLLYLLGDFGHFTELRVNLNRSGHFFPDPEPVFSVRAQ
jgi:hypothetical protein